jgi:DNA-binding beta-propeller fold protein YncE
MEGRAARPSIDKGVVTTMMRPRLIVFLLAIVAAVLLQVGYGAGTSARPMTSSPGLALPASARGYLEPGSNPSVLPGPVLIADRANNRLVIVDPRGRILWEFPRRSDLGAGQTFLAADDAFFSSDGKQIVATQEDDSVISLIDVAHHRIVFRYGKPGIAGSGRNRLSNPDDAMLLPGGWIITADIKNCRVLLIKIGQHGPGRIYGRTTQTCYHAPPVHWGSPNGAFPMRNGHFLVTEINGDWVDELTLAGAVVRSWHPPEFSYPSDSNEVRPGLYLSVDYTSPGAVETFDRNGLLRWRYHPLPGDPPLDHPSLAEPLPNGDVLLTDDGNDRVIVIDPRTDRVVWQYGHTAAPGHSAGYLDDPDGIDLTPPNSLLIRQRTTIGRP